MKGDPARAHTHLRPQNGHGWGQERLSYSVLESSALPITSSNYGDLWLHAAALQPSLWLPGSPCLCAPQYLTGKVGPTPVYLACDSP